MSVQVLDGVAPLWREHVGDDVPIHAGEPWVKATSHRLSSKRLTFLATEDGQNGGLQAAVIEDPAADEVINLYRMLLTEPKVFKFPADALAPRPGLRTPVAPIQDWLPNLVVMYPGFDTFVAASGGTGQALAGSLVDATVSWAAEHGIKAVSYSYVRADSELPDVLTDRGFRAIPLTYRARMTLPGSFDEYFSSLTGKKRLQVRRDLRNLAEAGVRTERCSVQDVWPDVLALRCDLVERYGQKPDEDIETMNMRRLLTCFGDGQTRLYCSFLDGRVVGFSLYVLWGGTWYAAYTGTYGSPRTRVVYFDHFLYAPLADAAAEGARVLDLGIGAFEAKRLRGCELTPVDTWVRALDPAVEQGLDVAVPAMLREDGWVKTAG
jgi:hypothetical protein